MPKLQLIANHVSQENTAQIKAHINRLVIAIQAISALAQLLNQVQIY
jgi:hypothetical protein